MGSELQCSNCNSHLDATDKFCRECGLPTVHRAETQRMAAASLPNVAELKRAMDIMPDPAPFERSADQPALAKGAAPELTTAFNNRRRL